MAAPVVGSANCHPPATGVAATVVSPSVAVTVPSSCAPRAVTATVPVTSVPTPTFDAPRATVRAGASGVRVRRAGALVDDESSAEADVKTATSRRSPASGRATASDAAPAVTVPVARAVPVGAPPASAAYSATEPSTVTVEVTSTVAVRSTPYAPVAGLRSSVVVLAAAFTTLVTVAVLGA